MKKLLIIIAIVTTIATPIGFFSQNVRARDFNAEIAAKEAEIAKFQAEATRLSSQADTLAVALAGITNEKNQIQAQIDVSQAKYDQLIAQIAETEKRIVDTQDALGTTIADLYVEDQVTPLEMIAGSKTISEYMDKQEYRTSIRNELSTKVTEIKALRTQLVTQKKDTENILTDQKNQRDYLAAKESEQQNLVSNTRGEEQAYQKLSEESKAAKRQLEIEQQAALAKLLGGYNVSAGDPNKGGYPNEYANSDYWADIPDAWGMYTRQCVSYVAWKVHQAHLLDPANNRDMPYWGGRGDANQWPGNARASGIPISSTPTAKTVGVSMNGVWGHVIWVESVNDDGTINLSQYNYCFADCGWGGSGRGQYSEMYNVSPSSFSYYIDF